MRIISWALCNPQKCDYNGVFWVKIRDHLLVVWHPILPKHLLIWIVILCLIWLINYGGHLKLNGLQKLFSCRCSVITFKHSINSVHWFVEYFANRQNNKTKIINLIFYQGIIKYIDPVECCMITNILYFSLLYIFIWYTHTACFVYKGPTKLLIKV